MNEEATNLFAFFNCFFLQSTDHRDILTVILIITQGVSPLVNFPQETPGTPKNEEWKPTENQVMEAHFP